MLIWNIYSQVRGENMQITNKQLVINIEGYLNKLWNVNSMYNCPQIQMSGRREI